MCNVFIPYILTKMVIEYNNIHSIYPFRCYGFCFRTENCSAKTHQ